MAVISHPTRMLWAQVLVGLVFLATSALAQPTAWSSQRYYNSVLGFRYTVRVLDLGTGQQVTAFDAPPGVSLGAGALTPDGRYYLVATSLGVARFTTAPAAFDRLFGSATAVTGLYVPPTGTLVHVTGDFGHAVLDWETGDLRSLTCCARPRLAFTPDGSRRIEVVVTGVYPATETAVAAYDIATNARLWSRSLPGSAGAVAASTAHLAIPFADETLVLDIEGGIERGRIAQALSGLHWRGDTLVAFRTLPGLPGRERISTYALPSLIETVLTERQYVAGRVDPIALHLSADGRYAYWLHFVSLLGLTVSNTSYSVFDLDEARIVASGYLGYQSQPALALEAAAQCVLSVPNNLTAPARGALVDVAVVPTPNCRPWSAPGALNPGPHPSAATIRLQVDANAGSQPQVATRAIGGTFVEVTQDAGLPASPILHSAVEDNRVRLSWEPGVGAGITAFEIQGALLGGSPSAVASVSAGLREWTSPPLGPASYVVRVVAGNYLGPGPPSNEVRFSIGAHTPPDAPSGLAATVVDDQVTLTWSPASSGPAPSGYVVEAAPAGVGAFVPVARTDEPHLSVIRVPTGPWQVRVRATTAGGVGGASGPVLVSPSACTAPPLAPQAPWPLSTYPSFTLRWSPPAAGSVEQYVIEVGSATGASDIASVVVAGTQTSVTVPQANPNALAVARVRARNACGLSAPSDEVIVWRP